MRWRRADHLLLQASAALDARYLEAAEKALGEAGALCPAHPLLPEVSSRLHAARDPSTSAGSQHYGHLWSAIVLAWLLAATILIG